MQKSGLSGTAGNLPYFQHFTIAQTPDNSDLCTPPINPVTGDAEVGVTGVKSEIVCNLTLISSLSS
jgi:hypothetical protein